MIERIYSSDRSLKLTLPIILPSQRVCISKLLKPKYNYIMLSNESPYINCTNKLPVKLKVNLLHFLDKAPEALAVYMTHWSLKNYCGRMVLKETLLDSKNSIASVRQSFSWKNIEMTAFMGGRSFKVLATQDSSLGTKMNMLSPHRDRWIQWQQYCIKAFINSLYF